MLCHAMSFNLYKNAFSMTETWTSVGCYQNRGRALGDVLFKPKRFAKIAGKYEQCVSAANDKGVTVFGFEDTQCWTGENPELYGLAKGKCGASKKGLGYGFMASETMFVYQKKGGNL